MFEKNVLHAARWKCRTQKIAKKVVIWAPSKSFVHWPIANLPWKFRANPFHSFCAELLIGRQTNRQTDKQRRLHIIVGGGNKNNKRYISLIAVQVTAICSNVQ